MRAAIPWYSPGRQGPGARPAQSPPRRALPLPRGPAAPSLCLDTACHPGECDPSAPAWDLPGEEADGPSVSQPLQRPGPCWMPSEGRGCWAPVGGVSGQVTCSVRGGRGGHVPREGRVGTGRPRAPPLCLWETGPYPTSQVLRYMWDMCACPPGWQGRVCARPPAAPHPQPAFAGAGPGYNLLLLLSQPARETASG